MIKATLQTLPTSVIRLDKDNPRIKHFLEQYDEISSELIALALSNNSNDNASTTYKSLKDSIKENGGIINPIVVSHELDGTYVVIEGNTRLQIYKEFERNNTPGEWDKIIALVYEQLPEDEKHRIRLQAHLVGPREWDPYSKAKYLYQLSEIENMNLNAIISMCGGDASDIKKSIEAYKYMVNYYKPIALSKQLDFDVTEYSKFKEHENAKIKKAIQQKGFQPTMFAEWVAEKNVNTAQGVRKIPAIMRNQEALNAFLKENITAADRILQAAELASADLSEYPYEVLASALHKQLSRLSVTEVENLANDVNYTEKLERLEFLQEKLKLVLQMVQQRTK